MQQFTEFLAAQGIPCPDTGPAGSMGKVREPLGSIAFSYGLLSADDVDLVLTEQRRQHRPFGEIACAMGMLTKVQVDSLVRIQTLRSAVETAEALVLAGCVSHDRLFAALGQFLVSGGVTSKKAAA